MFNVVELFNHRTISGKEDLPFNSYLYETRLIIWETVDDDSGGHMVHCCHCHHSCGPYAAKYTTTSTLLAHIRSWHSQLASCETEYKAAISHRLTTATMHKRAKISPFTLARNAGGGWPPGQLLNLSEYRKLMANMVIESNSSFKLVESTTFRSLITYCNGNVTTISRETVKQDIQIVLYQELYQRLKISLWSHISTGAKVNLTIDIWTYSNKLPFLAVNAH